MTLYFSLLNSERTEIKFIHALDCFDVDDGIIFRLLNPLIKEFK